MVSVKRRLQATSVETLSWTEKARSLAPLLEQYRDEGERERRLPQPLFEAFQEAGFMRMLKPRALGGSQADIEEALGVYEELSRHDGSLAWALMILTGSPFFSDYLSADAASEIFGADQGIVAGNFGPTGRATPVDGGYRVTGQWPFASGCQNANWFIGGCTVTDREGQLMPSGQGPEAIQVLMPAAECRILDTWRTAGLRGTGSHDIVADGVFVPTDHTFPFSWLESGPGERAGLGYPYPFETLGRSALAAVAFGIARDAIDSFKQLAATKTLKRGLGNLNSRHTVHEKVGRAEALLRSARLYTYETLNGVMATPSTATMQDLQLATAFSVQNAIEAVDLVFDCAGSSSVYETSRLERCFRDVHMISHHLAVAPLNIEIAGEHFLALPR
jgi:alkylation response protein AidB-like acyl-CoA dehydrogenase